MRLKREMHQIPHGELERRPLCKFKTSTRCHSELKTPYIHFVTQPRHLWRISNKAVYVRPAYCFKHLNVIMRDLSLYE
jgi:hypothetical protein